MTRRLFGLYLMAALAPLALAATAFKVQEILARRRRALWEGDGPTDAEALEHTVEEVAATP
jgi:hypothetical protein